MRVRGLRCSGRERYLIGHSSSKYVSQSPSIEQDAYLLKMDVTGDRIVVVWARNLYVGGLGIIKDYPASMDVSGDGHWVYIALHTVDIANNEFIKWAKLSVIDGSIMLAKGSFSGSSFERPNRKYSSILSFDGTEWWVPIQR